MDTPELKVWVVVKGVDDYGHLENIEVEEQSYPTQELAKKRVAHIEAQASYWWAWAWPVRINQEPMAPVFVMPPAPKMPPSAVFTPDGGQLLVAYDYDRRVFKQPGGTLSDAVTSAWNAWEAQQLASGNLEAVAPGKPPIEQLFEEPPSGSVRLFPRELP